MERFKVLAGSASEHCCFEATVVDTSKPTMMGGKHYVNSEGKLDYETVCECFDIDDANEIAKALNAMHQ